jgi:hypothetical protein
MSWNGAGNFNRIYSWVADKAAGLNISSTRIDADSNDIAANGFGNCLTRDGQGQPTANLPMANFRHTGVANGIARTDYASLGQTEDGVINWAVAAGTADAITATYAPAITTLVEGQLCFVRATAANTTAAPTFAPNGLTARTITRAGGGALTAGDIPGALAEIVLRYNLANTRWELVNPATLAPAANSITSAMLQAASVLYSKIQNVTNGRLLGNFSGGAAAPSEYAIGSGLAVSGTTLNNSALPPQAGFKNLSIKVASNTTVTVAADAVVMTDGAGNYRTAAISATCNLGSAGNVNQLDSGTIAIDTWYYIWAISNGTTDGTLASTSATAPTLPSGYIYKARIGAVQTVHATATLYGTWQLGRRVQYVVGLAQTAALPVITSGTNGTFSLTNDAAIAWGSPVSVAANGKVVPPTASEIFVTAMQVFENGVRSNLLVAPNNSFKAPYGSSGNSPPICLDTNGGSNPYNGCANFSLMLESTNIYWVSDAAGGGLLCAGWVDNI